MKKTVIIFLIACLASIYTFAQKVTPAEAWISYSVKYSMAKKWRMKGMVQWRPNNYADAPNPYIFQLEARKKLNKKAALNFQYRYSWFEGERNTQRLAMDGKFNWKVVNKTNHINYRSRLQVTRVNVNGQIISGFRNKIGFEKQLTKEVAVYFDYENFIELLKLKSFLRNQPPTFHKNRFTLGTKLQVDRSNIKAFYRVEQGIGSRNSLVHIVGFGISTKI